MQYVVTFEDYEYGAKSYVVDVSYIENAINIAKEKAKEEYRNYSDCDVLSVVRI